MEFPPPTYYRGRRSSLGNIYAGARTPVGNIPLAANFGRRSSLSNIHEESDEEPSPSLDPPVYRQRGRRQSVSDIYAAIPLQTPIPPTPSTTVRRDSHFTRRASAFPEKCNDCPASLRLFSFYKELKGTCSLKPAVECQYTCFTNVEATGREEESFRTEDLAQQAQEGALEEVQFQLYLKEVRRINPTLEEGQLFVDGLYELVCSRLPQSQESPLKKSVTDLLTVHSSNALLLSKYWRRPDDQSEHSAYLAVASSFVQYVLSTHGPRGVSQFLQKLDCSVVDPLTEKFSFKGKDVTSLEFKWTKFAEAYTNEEFSLSTLGMLKLLLSKYLARYWLSLALILLIMFFDAGATLGLAIATGQMINLGQFSDTTASNQSSLGETDLPHLYQLLQWAGIAVGLILFHFLLVTVTAGLQAHVAVCVCKSLRRQLSTRLHHVSPKFLSDYSSSAIISTFLQDVNVIEKLVAYSLRTVLFGALMLVTFVLYTTILIWQLALPLSLVYLAGQALVWVITAKLSEHSFAKSQATGKLCDILKEEIDGYQINRLYGLAKFWKSQFNRVLHNQFSKKARRSLFIERFTLLFQVTVPQIISTLLTFSFILLLQYGFISFESGLSIVLFFSYVVVHVVAAAGDFPTLQSATIALQRVNAMLYNTQHSLTNEPHEQTVLKQIQTSQFNRTFIPESLSVELRDVCFSYNATASHWNLFDVNLKIEAGERVAVLGKSGSGKSSLLNMILQVYEPTHGEVVFGEDEVQFNGLKVAATFQFNHIFNMSIRENIRIGNLQASDEEVEEAAKQADLHVWVCTLSRGYDTAVSSGGSSLSGGQKQRIAIARMLVARAPILVLDEVTSALDPATESKVFNKLMDITRGKTVVAVTHRLEQARQFDRIVVLSHGKVKEQGTHDELLALKGAYWCMCSNEGDISPEKAVPIIRRRGSIGSERQATPAIPAVSSAPALIMPMFTPLLPVAEVNELTISKSQPTLNVTKSSLDNRELNESPIPRTASTPNTRAQVSMRTMAPENSPHRSPLLSCDHEFSVENRGGHILIPIQDHTEDEGMADRGTQVQSSHQSVSNTAGDTSDERWWSCDSGPQHYQV